jgi:hypothetical protein
MMQAMGVPPTGQVAIGIAQRSVLQNPGGATAQLQGVGTKRGVSRDNFRREIAARQNTGTQTSNNNPVAAQLLLAPTFTPVQAAAVLDQANMRIAVPVSQVDGEYILVMQMMGASAQAAAAPAAPAAAAAAPAAAAPVAAAPAAQATTAPAAAPAAPAAAPAAEAPKPAESPKPANESTPALAPAASESTKTESSAAPAAAASSSLAPKPERRQEAAPATDKYGLPVAPLGACIMTMKQIDEMVASVQWAGQAPITQMMNDYVKAQTGKGLEAPTNGTAPVAAAAPASAAGFASIVV